MSSPPKPHPSSQSDPATDLKPGVRAARQRTGLTQLEVADRLGVSLDTYRRWDRGTTKPRDPEKQQLLARVLATPHEVLFPAAANPQVAQAMRLLDAEDAAAAQTAAMEDPGPGDDLWSQKPVEREAGGGADPIVHLAVRERNSAPAPAPAPAPAQAASVPDPLEVLRTIDGAGHPRRGGTPAPRPWARHQVRTVVGSAVVLAAIVGVVAMAVVVGSPNDAVPPKPAAQVRGSVGAVEQQRLRTARAMDAAADRHDYDLAIRIAAQLGDRAAAMRWKTSAARLLVSRAAGAAERGDLNLARTRLAKARSRYSVAPGAAAIEKRIAAIERRRRQREREKQREAARRRADARRSSGAPEGSRASSPVSPVGDASDGSSSTPEPEAPSAVPDPAPAPSSNGSSATGSSGGSKAGGSGGSGRSSPSETVDPGLF